MIITEKSICELVADMRGIPQSEVNGLTIIPETTQRALIESIARSIRVHLLYLPRRGLTVNEIKNEVKRIGG